MSDARDFQQNYGRKLKRSPKKSQCFFAVIGEFDRLYLGRLRLLSSVHWSSVNPAIRAAALATSDGQTRILDIDSGVGKFCTIGALTSQATFVGIEQRKYLIDAATEVAERLEIKNVQYIHANAVDVDWAEFQSIYLFNPFSENLDRSIHIDELCDLSVDLYVKYVRHTQWQLSKTRSGTSAIIYNQFGGELPPTFELVHKEEIDFMPLEVWRKK